MKEQVMATFREHKSRYGSRRISKALQVAGAPISRYKTGQVLNHYGLKAIQPRSFVPRTTDSRHPYKINPNLLVERDLP